MTRLKQTESVILPKYQLQAILLKFAEYGVIKIYIMSDVKTQMTWSNLPTALPVCVTTRPV